MNALLSSKSHTTDILETCAPYDAHRIIYEIPDKYNKNMIRWLTGNTDIYYDIAHLFN